MIPLIAFILLLSILIVIHEFGHFLAARLAGVRVEKFSIGFGPQLLCVRGKQTDFLLCAIPLGGYVKLAGESRQDCKGTAEEFFSQPVGIRARIVFAGPLFNYLLAFFILWMISLWGFPTYTTTVAEVLDGYPAQQAGLQTGDTILTVNDVTIKNWNQLSSLVYQSKQSVTLHIRRHDAIQEIIVPLTKKQVTDEFGRRKKVSMIGIAPQKEIIRYTIFSGFFKAAQALWEFTVITVKSFALMFTGAIPMKQIAGPLGIYQITSDMVKEGLVALLYLTAVLSVNLSVVNLLPIPVLDGGHLCLFGIEKLRKRPLSEKTEDYITRAGLIFICALFIFLLFNDISRIAGRFTKKAAHAPITNTTP